MQHSLPARERTEAVRVLLVDDEQDVTSSLKLGLRKTQWKVDTADCADDALALIRQAPYDVVVSDERMPGMQGSDLLTIVKAECPSAIRITLSGQASLERAVHAINSAEIHRFLLKPCPAPEVQAAIEELLEKREEQAIRSESLEKDANRETDALTSIFEAGMASMWMSYQPIFTCENELFGYEALLRTNFEAIRGPKHFFDIAETLNRSLELGRRVRDLIASELQDAPADAKIFVNVNPDHLADDSLYKTTSPLSQHAGRIIIEITERSTMADSDDLMESLDRLAGLGFLIAVDDLGSGYSGLNTFSLLSPDVVKFDMELIRNIDVSPTKQAVVGAMTELCKSLCIVSIAEGIETEAELATAKSLGCTLLQGFYLGAPGKGFSAPQDRHAA